MDIDIDFMDILTSIILEVCGYFQKNSSTFAMVI